MPAARLSHPSDPAQGTHFPSGERCWGRVGGGLPESAEQRGAVGPPRLLTQPLLYGVKREVEPS